MISALFTEGFFNLCGLKYKHRLIKKFLTNVSYCSKKNLSKFFLEKLTSDISGAHSITDNIILFGDYNINYFHQIERELLTEFASNNGLELVFKNPQPGQMEIRKHWLINAYSQDDKLLIQPLSSSCFEVSILYKFSFRYWILIIKTTKRSLWGY